MINEELRERVEIAVKKNFSEDELEMFEEKVGERYIYFVHKGMLMLGFVTFDIVKFDAYVQEDLGLYDYEKEGKSLEMVTKENYSDELCKMIAESCFLFETL